MTEKTYRYVAKDGRYRTRWRIVPKDGVELPTKRTKPKLGADYSIQVRTKAKKAKS